MSFGQYLEQLRTSKGFASQRALALTSGVSHATIARLENDTQQPTPNTLKVLSTHLGAEYEEMMQVAGYLDKTTTA